MIKTKLSALFSPENILHQIENFNDNLSRKLKCDFTFKTIINYITYLTNFTP